MTSAPRGGMHHSVFAKLVAVMVVMGTSLLVLVGGFFVLFVWPSLNVVVDRVGEEYARTVAATGLDSAGAARAAERLGVGVRYDGPAGAWATARDVPTFDAWRGETIAARDGGRYLFAWSFRARLRSMHVALHFLLLGLMLAVVLTAHAVIRGLLRPLRVLSGGVERLGGGQLDVRLPRAPADEFGRLTEAFNAMVERVRAMIEARDRLLVDVSHELRSPITRMKVTLELMPDGANRERLAEDVSEMERMVTELLELERLRDGRAVRLARQDLAPILRDVAARYRDTGPGVRLVEPERIEADVDAEQVRTVLRNLVENAVKHSPPDAAPIEIEMRARDGGVEVRVTDDGVGVPDDEVDRLFEPFYRVDRSRSKTTGGYGLGLSICKRVMEAHGGSIAVERTRARGASFVLRFPHPEQSYTAYTDYTDYPDQEHD